MIVIVSVLIARTLIKREQPHVICIHEWEELEMWDDTITQYHCKKCNKVK